MGKPEASSPKGRFITLEGGEGVGKSSQASRIIEALKAAGIDAIATREPGGTKIAEELREMLLYGDEDKWDPISETLLLNAARKHHVDHLIKPALDKGKWVVCDRFLDSTMAYQGYVKGVGRDNVEVIQRITLGDFKPDLTLIIDVQTDATLERVNKRKGKKDRIEANYGKMHRILRGAFLDIAGRDPERCLVIDGGGSLDMVTGRILGAINARFRTKLGQKKSAKS